VLPHDTTRSTANTNKSDGGCSYTTLSTLLSFVLAAIEYPEVLKKPKKKSIGYAVLLDHPILKT